MGRRTGAHRLVEACYTHMDISYILTEAEFEEYMKMYCNNSNYIFPQKRARNVMFGKLFGSIKVLFVIL